MGAHHVTREQAEAHYTQVCGIGPRHPEHPHLNGAYWVDPAHRARMVGDPRLELGDPSAETARLAAEWRIARLAAIGDLVMQCNRYVRVKTALRLHCDDCVEAMPECCDGHESVHEEHGRLMDALSEAVRLEASRG